MPIFSEPCCRWGRITLAGALLIFAAGFVASGFRPVLWLAGLAIGLLGPLRVEVGRGASIRRISPSVTA